MSFEQIAPPQADTMAEMSDTEIWNFLNTWTPKADPNRTEFWKEESISALGNKFAEFFESAPLRFFSRYEVVGKHSTPRDSFQPPWNEQTTVCKRIQASRRLAQGNGPSKDEWRNWLGLTSQLVGARPV